MINIVLYLPVLSSVHYYLMITPQKCQIQIKYIYIPSRRGQAIIIIIGTAKVPNFDNNNATENH